MKSASFQGMTTEDSYTRYRTIGLHLAVVLFIASMFYLLPFVFPGSYPRYFGSWMGVLLLCLVVFSVRASLFVRSLQRANRSLTKQVKGTGRVVDGGRDLDVGEGAGAELRKLAGALDVMARGRSQAEEALAASEERVRQLFECVPDATLVADSLGGIQWVNTATCQLCGLGKEELVGANMSSLSPMFAHSRVVGDFQYWYSEKPVRQEDLFYSIEGVRIPVEVNGVPTQYGGRQAVILTMRDITLRKQLEQTLDDAHGKAERLNRLQTEFLANISHEIRTPMNAIVGLSTLLKSTDLSEEQQDYAETIGASCHQLLGVLTDVIDLAKLESGYVDIASAPFDLQHLFFDLAGEYKAQSERKGLRFQAVIAPEMPEHFVGDVARVGQVLRHLLDNALKFTPGGSVVFRVGPAATIPDGSGKYGICFSVRDTGIGMTSDLQQMVFDMFSQVDGSATRRYGGMGIGLALCRKIVEKMGGALTLTSREGEGSVFLFVLSLKLVEPSVARRPHRAD